MKRLQKDVRAIHDPEKRFAYALKTLHNKETISQANKQVIEKFADHCLSEGIGRLRATKYIYTLGKLGEMLQMDFDTAGEEELRTLVKTIETSNEYTEWTKRDFKIALKKFYKWFEGHGDYVPDKIKWIKAGKKISGHRLPEELVTADEVKQLAEVTRNLRDRAIVLTLYESGARAGELLDLKIKHVVFDKYGALVMLNGKTGMRRIRLVASVPALSGWLSIHPAKDDKDAWLWSGISNNNIGERLSYLGLTKLLTKLSDKAKLNKKLHPHLFRHSRATELARHVTEAQLCMVMGWIQGSKQAATYVHLSQRDTDNAILGMYGLLEKGESESEKLMTLKCPRCHQNNSPETKFCFTCGMALDIKAVMEAEDQDRQMGISLIEVLKNPEFADKIIGLLEQLAKEK